MQLIQPLFTGKLDVVGDIHGEIEALENLLKQLGYSSNGDHPDNRRLVFVGDLCDRGPDTLAVLRLVKRFIDAGKAQCVLGNHELNLLNRSHREGNGWFFGSPHPDDRKNFNSTPATAADRQWILEFLATLPIALESTELRIVHACWHEPSIQALKDNNFTRVVDAYEHFKAETNRHLEETGIAAQAKAEQQRYGRAMHDGEAEIPLLPSVGKKTAIEQSHNPVRTLTSGLEQATPKPFFIAGKWRMTERTHWWDNYQQNTPVVMGHYWRHFKQANRQMDVFNQIKPLAWFGAKNNVFCIDYSVGKRFVDRQQSRAFTSTLAALQWPEKTVTTENGDVFTT